MSMCIFSLQRHPISRSASGFLCAQGAGPLRGADWHVRGPRAGPGRACSLGLTHEAKTKRQAHVTRDAGQHGKVGRMKTERGRHEESKEYTVHCR